MAIINNLLFICFGLGYAKFYHFNRKSQGSGLYDRIREHWGSFAKHFLQIFFVEDF